jgi:hypothetical protein
MKDEEVALIQAIAALLISPGFGRVTSMNVTARGFNSIGGAGGTNARPAAARRRGRAIRGVAARTVACSPGTGLWQMSGRSEIPFLDMVRLDLH